MFEPTPEIEDVYQAADILWEAAIGMMAQDQIDLLRENNRPELELLGLL